MDVVVRKYPKLFLLVAAAIILVFAASCEETSPISLSEIKTVSPPVIEPGDTLVIEGSGFVKGPTKITLDGEFDPVGLVPPSIHQITLHGTAVSDTKIVRKIDEAIMGRITPEAAEFNGQLKVQFPTAMTDTPIKIQATIQELHIELRPSGGGVQISARRLREAEEIFQILGIGINSQNTLDELLIDRVTKDSIADRGGIEAGARLLAVDGVALASPSDLAGLNLAEEHRLEFVSNRGQNQVLVARLSQVDPLEKDEFAAVLLTSIALGLFIAIMLPRFRRPTFGPPKGRNPLWTAFGLGVAGVPILLFPALVIAWKIDIVGTVFLLALGFISLVVVLMYSDANILSRFTGFIVYAIPMLVVILIGSTSSNNFGLFEVVKAQGETRWGLHVWSNPFTMLTTIVALSLAWPSRMLGYAPRGAALIGGWSLAIVTSAVVVFYCLGGWQIPGIPTSSLPVGTPAMAVAVTIFALKTWLVLSAARAMAGASNIDRRKQQKSILPTVIRAGILIALAAAAFGWEWTTMPEDFKFAAQIISAGLFFTLVTAFLWMQFAKVKLTTPRAKEPSLQTS